MSNVDQAKFTCDACGKQYAWKTELAGKKAKCKCGHVMQIPAAAPVAGGDEYEVYAASETKPKQTRAPAAALADDRVRCPSCGAGMEAGAVLCVSCGFNLKTGKKISADAGAAPGTPPAPTSGAAAAAVPGYRPIRREEAAPGGSPKTKIIVGGVLLLGVVGAIIGMRLLAGSEPNVVMKGDDAEIERMMKKDGVQEIKQWLAAHKSRMVMGMTRAQAEARADQFYKMGAKKVLAFSGVITASLVIELPDDPAQRKELFDWQDRWHSEMFEKVAEDVGQKYLLIKCRA